MRIFSYRNKQRAKTALVVLGILLLIFLGFVLCRFLYLQRFLVYTPTSVELDYNQDLQSDRNPTDSAPEGDFPVDVVIDDSYLPVSTEETPMQALRGYYITTDMLQDINAVTDALNSLETQPEALLLELKSIYGNYYYNSNLYGAVIANADTAAIQNLIQQYQQRNTYLIARIPAFTDNNFALANQPSGLPLRSGALWMDENSCYWLDPLDETVQNHLVSIATELAGMGFDEIVFENFRIPDSQNIVYDSGELTREGVAAEAAQALRTALSGLSVRVSFGSESPMVAQYSDRIYMTTDDGSRVADLVAGVSEYLEDPSAQVVFQTASRDTRFEGYGILRPLIEGISSEE